MANVYEHFKPVEPIPIGLAAKLLGMPIRKLRGLDEAGQIQSERTYGGHRRYSLAALADLADKLNQEQEQERKTGDDYHYAI